jgi:ketosteroid isomerase-like protein
VIDLAEAIEDDELWARNEHLFDPRLTTRFMTPEAAGVRVMEGAYEGIEGLRAGWRAWLEPWDSWRVEPEKILDSGADTVLLLTRSTARMRDSGTEVPQATALMVKVDAGKVVEMRFYLDQQQAKRDAGLT